MRRALWLLILALTVCLTVGCGGGGGGAPILLPNTGPPVTVNGRIDAWTLVSDHSTMIDPAMVTVFSGGHGGDSRYLIAKKAIENAGIRVTSFQLIVPHEGLYDFDLDFILRTGSETARGTASMMNVRLTAPTTAVTILSGGP